MARVLLDFDGTLAHPRPWSMCIIAVLDELAPGHGLVRDDVRPHLRDGFPWHRPDEPHLHLGSPDAWWGALDPLLSRAFHGCGLAHELIEEAVAATRRAYCAPDLFVLYDDTLESLERLRSAGHEPVILSNHVPELPSIVEALGLGAFVYGVYSSATIGFDKPHPDAFRIGLAGSDPADAWMIGDNPEADVAGAERVGMNAILVRRPGHPDLLGAVDRLP